MSEETINGGITISDTEEKFNGTIETVPYERSQAEAEALASAVAAFEEDRRSASFSKRNPDLGKMINCSLCGMRHRVHDPVMLGSTAHGEQVFGEVKNPSRAAFYARKRLHPHFKQRSRDFVERVREIIPAYGVEQLDLVRGIVRAQLKRERRPGLDRAFSRQKLSRRINWGLTCS